MPRTRTKRILGVPDEFWIAFLIMVGFFLKLVYDIKLGYTAGTADAGVWEFLPPGTMRGGHIGYIQYLFTNHSLPDADPRGAAAFTNPPLFYLVCSLILEVIHRGFGWAVGTCLHCLQCLNVIYVLVGECCGIGILSKLGVKGRKRVEVILILFFFPGFYHLGASLDGGAMTFMFSMLALNSTMSWYNSRRYKTLRNAGIELGLGLMTSFMALLVLPVILLLIRNGFIDGRRNEVPVGKQIRTFALTAAVLGLWWPVYRLVRFGVPLYYVETRGVPTVGSFLSRLRLPSAAMLHHLHSDGTAALESNIWAQTFKTAIFDFNGLNLEPRACFMIGLFMLYLSIAICVTAHIMLLYSLAAGKMTAVFRHMVELGYLLVIGGYLLFCFLYPTTGTMDFKYLLPVLLFPVAGAGLCGTGDEQDTVFEKVLSGIFDVMVLVFSLVSAFMFGFYYA